MFYLAYTIMLRKGCCKTKLLTKHFNQKPPPWPTQIYVLHVNSKFRHPKVKRSTKTYHFRFLHDFTQQIIQALYSVTDLKPNKVLWLRVRYSKQNHPNEISSGSSVPTLINCKLAATKVKKVNTWLLLTCFRFSYSHCFHSFNFLEVTFLSLTLKSSKKTKLNGTGSACLLVLWLLWSSLIGERGKVRHGILLKKAK